MVQTNLTFFFSRLKNKTNYASIFVGNIMLLVSFCGAKN